MMTAAAFFTALLVQDPTLKGITARGDGTYVAAKPLLFHWTMIIGTIGDEAGYDDRYCYADELLCITAIDEWKNANGKASRSDGIDIQQPAAVGRMVSKPRNILKSKCLAAA